MYGFKSAILAIFQFWQNGTFEPMHGIQNFFWLKDFFWTFMKMTFTKNIPNMSQGPPNPGFRYLILENWDFLKKDSVELKFFLWFRFLWIPRRPGMLNWERLFFWPSKNLYRQCESISLSWPENSNKLLTVLGGKFKFSAQDEDRVLEYLF